MADWKDEARGIPVWVGANLVGGMVCVAPHKVKAGRRVYGSATAARLDGYGLREVCEVDVDPFVLALDNPDTQAAYLRRLALRLGCPEEVAGEGVMFYRRGDWFVAAGPWEDDVPEWYAMVGNDDVSDRLLALVRAWRTTNDG